MGNKKMPKIVYDKCDDVSGGDGENQISNVMINTQPITFGTTKNAGNAENVDKFICEMCDFKCSKYSNYVTHLATRKHQLVSNKMITMNHTNNAETNQDHHTVHVLVVPNTCPNCNKYYLHRSGLSRHRKTCITPSSAHTNNASQPITRDEYNNILQLLHELKNKDKPTSETNEEYSDDNDIYPKQNIKISSNDQSHIMIDNNIQNKLMLELIKSNAQLQAQMYEICKSSQALTTNNISAHTIDDNSTTNNTNNSHNNTFNMNMFLNEKCKDAMNMKEFVNSIQLNMTDLENVGRLGYVEGMSNIFIDNLQKTDVYKRPVHCSDVKRETLYVKENNEWQRDGPQHEKMTNAILAVEHKNVVLVNEWANANPRCMDSSTRENEKYFRLSRIVTDGEKDGNIDKVIRKVAKKVTIEKDPTTPQIE
jgi:hypothetical protein